MSDAPPLREQFDDEFQVGAWIVEPMRNRIWLDDEEVQLEPKVMDVLLCMARRPGKTITKSQFKDEVWRDTVVTDDVLSRCISELRKVFDDDPRDPAYIETVRKTGYCLIAPVQRSDPPSPDSFSTTAVDPKSTEAGESSQPLLHSLYRQLRSTTEAPNDEWVIVAGGTIRRTWLLVLGGLLVTLVAVGLSYWLVPVPSTSEEAPLSPTPFTSYPGEEFDPALSRSGDRAVFAWRKPNRSHQNIYLIQRGAERPLQLSPDSTVAWSPTWSPEERFVAYAEKDDQTHQVSIVPSIGGQSQQVLRLRRRRLRSIAWVPDTSRRALVISAQRRAHQTFALSTLYPNADSVASLTSPPLWSVGDTHPIPSPDGSQIAFMRRTVEDVGNIFTVSATGTGPARRVTADSTAIYGLTWTADGSELVYAAQRAGVSGLWRVPVAGGTPTLIQSANGTTRLSHPTFAPQSERLAYVQETVQLDVWKLSRLDRYAEFSATPLLSSTQADTRPSIAPSGDRIAFISERSGTPEVWTARADGSEPDQLTSLGGPTIHSVQWSPDGSQLCLVARRDGQSDLYVVSETGGPLSQLTRGTTEDLRPRWSPNGRWIYFASNRTGIWEAWRTRAAPDTHRTQQVTAGGAVAAQASATDSTLYFVRPDTVGLWEVPLDPTRFPLHTGPQGLPIRTISDVSPRERVNWWVGPDGIHFVHRYATEAVLAYYDFASHRILPLYPFPDQQSVRHLSPSPGGQWFAYTHTVRRESDVMLLDRLR